MNTTPPKINALKSFVQADLYQMISENVLEWVTFVNLLIPEEYVQLVSQLMLSKVTEFVSKLKSHIHVQLDNIWEMTISATKSANSVKFTTENLEPAQNVSTIITLCTLESVFPKDNADPDNSSSTTTVKMSAPPVETLTDKPESVSTVPHHNTNFTTDSVSQLKPVESDNGPMTQEIVTMSVQDATNSTHQLVTV